MSARLFEADVTLEIAESRVVARSVLDGEKGVIRRLTEGSGAPIGLRSARTGDPAFDDGCELFSETGEAPRWLTPVLRAAILSLHEPVTATVDENGFHLELPRLVQDPALLERLVEISAATGEPTVSSEGAARLTAPIHSKSSIYWRLAMFELVALPIALVAFYYALRSTELAELQMGVPGQEVGTELEVHPGDVIEIWQDGRFDAERTKGTSSPKLWLEIQATDGSDERWLRCNPYMVNRCTVIRTVGPSTTLTHAVDCYVEECGPLRADRAGKLRVRARLKGDDPSRPYVTDHRLRFKRRSRLLSF